jgi:ribonuclease HI
MSKRVVFNAKVHTDGGCSNNQNKEKRNAYGSFRIAFTIEEGDSSKFKGEYHSPRLEYGNRSNNEAEYLALIDALEFLHKMLTDCEIDCEGSTVLVLTDSKLMCNQLTGAYQVKNSSLKTLYNKAKHEVAPKIKELGVRMVIRNVGRKEIVKVLGH